MREPLAELDTRALDERIDQVLALAPQQGDDGDTQCMRDLHYLYHKDQILTRAAQRLMLADASYSLNEQKSQIGEHENQYNSGGTKMMPGTFKNDTGKTAPLSLSKEMPGRSFTFLTGGRGRRRHILVTVSAALTLVVIVAFALLAVSSFYKLNTGVSSQPRTSQTASSASTSLPTVAATSQSVVVAPTVAGSATNVTNGNQSLAWPYGQSTYWANQRYHQLAGYWVQWHGNADQWVAGAQAAGWHYSTAPHVPSILVLMPYVQGAGRYGHVGVVESLPTSTKVHTSNMDWYVNGGGLGKISYYDFIIGPGVYFIWR